jgi:hypothetical protein
MLLKKKKKDECISWWVSCFLFNKKGRWFAGLVLLGLLLIRHRPDISYYARDDDTIQKDHHGGEEIEYRDENKKNSVEMKQKKILFYTTYWGMKDFQFGTGRQPFLDNQCPVSDCVAHARKDVVVHNMDEQTFGSYDAVLFAPTDLSRDVNLSRAKEWRRPHQRFVYFNMESPLYMGARIHNPNQVKRFFNWTMTYRWDSDIPRPYGWFQQRNTTTTTTSFYPKPPRDDWLPYREHEFIQSMSSRPRSFHALAQRPGKVAWIVSNCRTTSQREDYVRMLNQHIPVDMFGKCQQHGTTCDTTYSIHRDDNCTTHVQHNHKFYLSFENAHCKDYVTEKFFRRIDSNVVIALGQANYSRLAPPHSYIHVMDYPNPKALADYLHRLDQNRTEYLSYFWWKDHYNVVHPHNTGSSSSSSSSSMVQNENNFGQAMCRLCAKLHANENDEPMKVYDDFEDWWDDGGECGKSLDGLQERMSRATPFPGMMRSKNITNKQAENHLKAFLPGHR